MKKKIVALFMGTCMAAMILSGCSSSNEASNDYVTVVGYKGVEVDKVDDAQEITDDDVDEYIDSVLEQNAESKEITDRAVKEGDTVDIKFVGKIDGAEFDGGSSDSYPLVIGSGTFIDGFEDSIIGHKVGDTFDWEGKFPDDYSSTDLAGKDVTFTITVNSITENVKPELNDEFVATVSDESKTVDEYKAEIKKTLEEQATETYDSTLSDEAWTAVVEKAEVKEYPEDEVKKISDDLTQQYTDVATANSMTLEELLDSQMGITVDEFNSQVKEAAEASVKQQLVAEAIAEKENLVPSDKEYEEEFQKLADQYGYEDVDALKEVADEDTLKQLVLQTIVQDWLAEHAVQVVND